MNLEALEMPTLSIGDTVYVSVVGGWRDMKIVGVRLEDLADTSEPTAWEYQVVIASGPSKGDEWGWCSRHELIRPTDLSEYQRSSLAKGAALPETLSV